ncbi:glycoside hydrolase family 30 protein [Luteolibacter sp. LG18]|uniref:glycoside hydrolase family 30 protein n=1 Tax=Luteolibacter sp. LG18 TaxID=2819286 RepID=UPI002B304818|nr:hypothetical protein llg_28060 [Luteolibacter sp. LG18]
MSLHCLRIPAAVSAIAVLAAASLHAQDSLQWKRSTQAAPWTDQPAVALGSTVPLPTSTSVFRVFVNSAQTSQTIDGWGGCFNERGWKAMEVLSAADRDTVMRALFDPQTGLKLNLARTPIGASDYAISPYSLNETAGDYAMANFSIARDQQRLLPYIKAALALRPDLYLWAVPWSPPSWMKSNNSLINGGNIKDDDQTLAALAKYFTKYLQAYEAEGVEVAMVMPQNEPNITNNYPTCSWTGVQFSKFIGYHLGPALANAGLDTKIFLGTYNETSRGGYSYWVAPSMQDPQTRPYISGIGCQWSADGTMNETRMVLPNLKLMQTETECNHPNSMTTNTNDWTYAEYQYQLAKKWFTAGASSHMLWNLVLDETGLSTGGWAQCSPIVVNSSTKAVTYTPFYYLYKHFSFYIQPGARLVSSYSSWGDKIAFVNPDGSVVVVMGNSAGSSFQVTLNIDGRQSDVVTLPAHSFSTFYMPAPLTALQKWRLQYFNVTSDSGIAADAMDADGDGMVNLQEFISGTDPTNADSVLRVSRVQSGQPGMQVTFTSVSGKTYDVEYTDDLNAGVWSVLRIHLVGTGGPIQIVDPNAATVSRRFYRIVAY